MKKQSIVLLLILYFFAFVGIASDDEVWTGLTRERKLFNKLPWFKESYNSYEPMVEDIQRLKNSSISSYKILAFGGTWCKDTKELLPKFYKTIHQSGLNSKNVKLYFLNKELTSPDDEVEKKYQVVAIPTFILFKNGKEVGRIVEKERISIENDLLQIIEAK